MDKSRNNNFLFFYGIKRVLKWVRRSVFIIIAAFMIGFTNAFNDELRWINDTRNFDQPEQIIDDEDTNQK